MTGPVPVWLRRAALGLLGAELALVGVVALPSVHSYYDPVGIRDAGTVWTALTWNPSDRRLFLPAAVLGHIEGPLQFLFLNAYYHAIGNLLPLDPVTTQIPNTVAAWLAVLVAYRLGCRVGGARSGLLAALSLGLMPWLAVTLRLPWVFVTFSTLLEVVTLYAYVRLAEGDAPRWRALAPACLAAYLSTGLDWPSFGLVLALFLWRAGALGRALRSRWNLLPAAMMGLYVVWTVALWAYGRFVHPPHAHLYRETMLLYPFFKIGGAAAVPTAGEVGRFVIDTFGLTWAVAVGGAAWSLAGRGPANDGPRAPVVRAFWTAMAAWLIVFSIPLLRLPSSETYGYVVALPAAAFAGRVLAGVRPAYAVGALAVMVAFQLQPLRGSRVTRPEDDDRRVPAAATFLIESRPDLLAAGRVAFLPGDTAANVGQYARGENDRVLMPLAFPGELRSSSVGSPEPVLRDLVLAYRDRGELRADWVVLSTEALAAPGAAGAFYRRLLVDPRLTWPACFTDRLGRGLWLGEAQPQASRADTKEEFPARSAGGEAQPQASRADTKEPFPARSAGGEAQPQASRADTKERVSAPRAPCRDVAALAAAYERRYDRIAFLKRHVRHILHY